MTDIHANRNAARLFGIFFILTFLSYGIGSSLVDGITSSAEFPDSIQTNSSKLAFSSVLMAIVHSVLNIALPVLMLPILRPFGERLAYGYLGIAILATSVLAVGAVFLLMLIPLGNSIPSADQLILPALAVTGDVLASGGTISYHLGMALWAIGGMLFCTVLFRSDLLPKFMPVWGMIGYVALAAGSISELFVHNLTVEIASVVPGGLFEVTLSIWLIAKGFNHPQSNTATQI